MYRIFMVEDDPVIAGAVAHQCAAWDMEVKTSTNFRNVLEELIAYQPHLVLMDIGLPFYDGYHWCSRLRQLSTLPVIFISSASDNMNMVMAMNMGADDFIAKPFDSGVLVAKIQALLRRTYDFSRDISLVEHRGVMVNTGDGTVTYQGRTIELTRNESKILTELMRNKGKIVSRERLMEALWQTDSFVDENTLTVNVGRLRKKLAAAGVEDLIQTKFGQGYLVE